MEKNYLSDRFKRMIFLMQRLKVPSRVIVLVIGIISTIWFLIRVIPKPSRAAYPCMRVAAPWASAFVIYLLSISASALSLKKFRFHIKAMHYPIAVLFIIVALLFSVISLTVNPFQAKSAQNTPLESPNQPMGIAKGIFPGRVVWVYNPLATNESCTNTYGDGYFMSKNTDQHVVDQMLDEAVKEITGELTVSDAWDAIFHYFNIEAGKGDVGYTEGEIVFIKVNATSTWAGNITNTFERGNNSYYAISETSPHLVLAVLRKLVNLVGVPQNKIYVGDPMKKIYQDNFTMWHNEFPDVHYLDNNSSQMGRERVVPSTTAKIVYSDNRTVMTSAGEDFLYTIFEDMDYMINIPTMKGHKHAGVTLFAKNHFGSNTRSGANHLHPGLVDPQDGSPVRNTYGQYRVQVDIMTHYLLGKKNLIYLMDALYTSDDEIDQPDKWDLSPFNGDWTSSIFISQDPIAIESVGFDFLYAEFDGTNGLDDFPHLGAVDDYLHQLADSTNWPAGIIYSPNGDGVPNSFSYGVHEHWNNPVEKRYSRNLGIGNGIELVKVFMAGQFTSDKSDLLSDRVASIYVDSFDAKWFGTDQGISRFDNTAWTDITTGNFLMNNNIRKIAYEKIDNQDNLWIATEGGLSRFLFDINGVISANTYTMGNSNIINNDISAFAVDSRHNRWACTPVGLSVWNGTEWADISIYMDENHEWKSFEGITLFGAAAYDTLMLIASDNGVIRFSYEDVDGFTGASAYGEGWSGLGTDNVNFVGLFDGVQWYGTPKGAFRHHGNETKQGWEEPYTTDSGLVSNNVRVIEIDDSGNIWFGTDKGLSIKTLDGWYKYPTGMQASELAFSSGLEETVISWNSGTGMAVGTGLINPVVNDIKKDFSGNVWVATNGGLEFFSSIPGIPAEGHIAKRVAFIREGNSGSITPVDGVTYVANPVFGEGSSIGSWYCVYNGQGNSVVVTGLTANTEYRVMVCEYSGATGDEGYITGTSEGNPANFTAGVSAVNHKLNEPISIYPVPFDDFIMIKGSELHQGSIVSIYSLNGRLLKKIILHESIARINTSDLDRGAYMLQVKNGNKYYSVKIVK
jgi:hypothetical protein